MQVLQVLPGKPGKPGWSCVSQDHLSPTEDGEASLCGEGSLHRGKESRPDRLPPSLMLRREAFWMGQNLLRRRQPRHLLSALAKRGVECEHEPFPLRSVIGSGLGAKLQLRRHICTGRKNRGPFFELTNPASRCFLRRSYSVTMRAMVVDCSNTTALLHSARRAYLFFS